MKEEIYEVCRNYNYDIETKRFIDEYEKVREWIFAVRKYPDGEHRITLQAPLGSLRLDNLTPEMLENKINDRYLSFGRYVTRTQAMQEFCPHEKIKYFPHCSGYGVIPDQREHSECLICGRSQDGTTINQGKIYTEWELFEKTTLWCTEEEYRRKIKKEEEEQKETEKKRTEMYAKFGIKEEKNENF